MIRKTKYRKNHQTGRLQTDYLLSCQVVYLCRQPLDAGQRFRYGVSIIPDDYDPIAYVVSKSMEPKIRNSDYLFIKNTPQIDYNTIGIFQVDGANYVKKLRQGYLKKNSIPNTPTSTQTKATIFVPSGKLSGYIGRIKKGGEWRYKTNRF